jgi:hypothetical protein
MSSHLNLKVDLRLSKAREDKKRIIISESSDQQRVKIKNIRVSFSILGIGQIMTTESRFEGLFRNRNV